ncbi:MAG: glutamate 5-kinase [Anaerolineales bacterium]|nr:MAG: glutamate 5-kinase [Anaerolineales bacterium]
MDFHRIVVKLGTSTLTAGTTQISAPRLVELVRQMASLQSGGAEIVLVTSGAMAAGRAQLNFPALPKDIPAKQMLAAVGQPRLMALYEQLFGLYGITVAQVLLTRSDLSDRRRYLNSRNTLGALLAQSVLPVVNENDTVATEEIRLGDNDNLSALVTNLIEADLLVLLTDQPGLFTADPRRNPQARMIREVNEPEIPKELWQAAGGSRSNLGTGGMLTKLQAADLARRSGATVAIAQGGEAEVLTRLVAGEPIGTRFLPTTSALEGRKRYLLAGGQTAGKLYVDHGAAQALHKGGSLLPVGVQYIKGSFERGDTVTVKEEGEREVARGLVNYAAEDLAQLCGQQSSQIETILGYAYGEEVIHRNNMVLL